MYLNFKIFFAYYIVEISSEKSFLKLILHFKVYLRIMPYNEINERIKEEMRTAVKNFATSAVSNLLLNISTQAVDLILFRMRLFTFQQQRVTEVRRLRFAIQTHITKRFCHLLIISTLSTAVLTKLDLKLRLQEYLTITAKNSVFLRTATRNLPVMTFVRV